MLFWFVVVFVWMFVPSYSTVVLCLQFDTTYDPVFRLTMFASGSSALTKCLAPCTKHSPSCKHAHRSPLTSHHSWCVVHSLLKKKKEKKLEAQWVTTGPRKKKPVLINKRRGQWKLLSQEDCMPERQSVGRYLCFLSCDKSSCVGAKICFHTK